MDPKEVGSGYLERKAAPQPPAGHLPPLRASHPSRQMFPSTALKGPSTGLPITQSLGGRHPIAHSSTEARLPHLSPATMRASLHTQESGHWGRKALPSLPGPRGGRRPEGASSYAVRCPAARQECAPCPLAFRASVGSPPEQRGPEASLPRRWGWPRGGGRVPCCRWS